MYRILLIALVLSGSWLVAQESQAGCFGASGGYSVGAAFADPCSVPLSGGYFNAAFRGGHSVSLRDLRRLEFERRQRELELLRFQAIRARNVRGRVFDPLFGFRGGPVSRALRAFGL